jgi:hypothetical protein
MQSDHLSTVFGALADPTRRAILMRLADGDLTVTELSRPFPMSQPHREPSNPRFADFILRSSASTMRKFVVFAILLYLGQEAILLGTRWVDDETWHLLPVQSILCSLMRPPATLSIQRLPRVGGKSPASKGADFACCR